MKNQLFTEGGVEFYLFVDGNLILMPRSMDEITFKPNKRVNRNYSEHSSQSNKYYGEGGTREWSLDVLVMLVLVTTDTIELNVLDLFKCLTSLCFRTCRWFRDYL
jgi:hypothetical protein